MVWSMGFQHVKAEILPRAWEESILSLAKNGRVVMTEYREKSLDISVAIEVLKPLEEPRIHLKGVVVGKLSQLFDYVDEVLEGTADWRVGKDWHYTYHERLFRYGIPSAFYTRTGEEIESGYVNQIEYMVYKLAEAPYSRRAIAVTWQAWKDTKTDSPPCTIYLFARVVDGRLCMHTHMRSNDSLKCAFMNMYAFTELQRRIAERLNVEVGYYLHIADSYHVYERDWKWFRKFVEQIESGKSERYWLTTEEYRKIAERKVGK